MTNVKNLANVNAFLQAFDRPEHRALCASDPLLVALAEELVARQSRYRLLQNDYGDATCSHCPHGGCCHREFVRVLDLIFRLAIAAPIPPAINGNDADCSFLGATGCTLTPSPLPRICVTFQCGTLSKSGPSGFGDEAARLAAHASDISQLLISYVGRRYMLLDADGEIALDSSAALIAPIATLPLELAPRDQAARTKKRILPTNQDGRASMLPIISSY